MASNRDSLTWTLIISNLSIQQPSAKVVVGNTRAGAGGEGSENGNIFKCRVPVKAV